MTADGEHSFAHEGSELRRSVAAAAGRIDGIILEAERVAERIRAEAVAEADRYRAERRSEADRVAERQLTRLQAALDVFRAQLRLIEEHGAEAIRSIEAALASEVAEPLGPAPQTGAREPGSGTVSELGAMPARSESPIAEAIGEPTPEQPRTAGEDREGAIIRAAQLAIKGSDRAQITEVLRAEFGLDDPAAVVGEVLGHD